MPVENRISLLLYPYYPCQLAPLSGFYGLRHAPLHTQQAVSGVGVVLHGTSVGNTPTHMAASQS